MVKSGTCNCANLSISVIDVFENGEFLCRILGRMQQFYDDFSPNIVRKKSYKSTHHYSICKVFCQEKLSILWGFDHKSGRYVAETKQVIVRLDGICDEVRDGDFDSTWVNSSNFGTSPFDSQGHLGVK